MMIPAWVDIVLFFAFLIFAITFSFSVITEARRAWRRKQVRRMLFQGLLHDDLSYEDLKHMQITIGLSDHQMHLVLSKMKVDIDYGSLDKRDVLKRKVDDLLAGFKTHAPFSELPEMLVESLKKVRDDSATPALVDGLGEKISVYIRKKKIGETVMKVITYLGFIVGLIGTGYGFYK
ncbi:TPA: hypothetical protein OMS75_001356 [Enterobacter cloacae]|nr:hypothetical protein [Enterobacter cloacae]